MIRFVLLNIFIVLFTIICCIIAVIISFFTKRGRLIRHNLSMIWSRVILRVCGIRVQVKGLENLPNNGPFVFMSNHQSYFDIFALLAYLPTDFKFILKQELMRIPLFGLTMKRAGHIAIKRENTRKAIQSIDQLAQKIKSGDSVLIFPEGTRSKDGHLQPLKKGGFHLALKSGCHIVPIAISNSYRIVVKGSFKINKDRFSIHFGRPIPTEGYEKKSMQTLMGRVRDAISGMMAADNG